MTRTPPKDAAERERAIRERSRNVIVDAGAGTGKTTLLVARILHLIAPEDDGPCFPLERVAAITFTRKAAGELKLRLRQALLEHNAQGGLSVTRAARLAHAIELLDNAPIGTVHSFADRLLRLRPADARISPQYEIAENQDELIQETYRWLLEAVKQDTLVATFRGTELEALAHEASQTLRMYVEAGFLQESEVYENYAKAGLDWFVRDLIVLRDRKIEIAPPFDPDMAHVRRVADELGRLLLDHRPSTTGGRILHRLLATARRLAASRDLGEALRHALTFVNEHRRAKLQKGRHFGSDDAGWEVWRWISDGESGKGKSKQTRDGGPLHQDLVRPLLGWIAHRLVRLRPIILARYQQVKRERQVLDQVDLLIELRDLLQRDLEARAFYQQRFDHILVDEFQDTDPLQAEILMFLCEHGAHATKLDELTLAPAKLTIVGDPKQSIYRFRRADIAMYIEVCDRVRKSPTCESRLSVNFRSTPQLIDWVNAGFDAVLGAAETTPAFDKEKGAVCNMRLSSGRSAASEPSVHVLPFGEDRLRADESRAFEGQALARYLRWLVETSSNTVVDPRTGEPRPIRYGDIAVLMVSTQKVHFLLGELDQVGVPHVVRGGTLFMEDDLHRQFLLGLRAISDPKDGVAQAALLRPPFFAVSLADLVFDRFKTDSAEIPAVLAEARSTISSLRELRHRLSPGELARTLLERSGFGTFVAAGPNGAQRLARLYELCLAIDLRARELHLDFDGITRLARDWIDEPIHMEAPLPIDADAVQVITVHQAKGLEWPVVALWDGRASWNAFLPRPALSVDAFTGHWSVGLDGLRHDSSDLPLRDREISLLEEERKRIAYVAATRARDILIVPEAGAPKVGTIAGKLLMNTATLGAHRVGAYLGDGEAWWHLPSGPSVRPVPPLQEGLDARWREAASAALQPQLVPMGVSAATHVHREAEEGEEPPPRKNRDGRYGPAFGSTVHRALELLLTKRVADVTTAVARAAGDTGLTEHLSEAEADVARTCAALSAAGLTTGKLRLEYPIAGSLEPGELLTGYIDLLVVTDDELVVVDFKTDQPPQEDPRAAYPQYAAQVAAYAQLLRQAGVGGKRHVRCVLLFTGDGGLWWV